MEHNHLIMGLHPSVTSVFPSLDSKSGRSLSGKEDQADWLYPTENPYDCFILSMFEKEICDRNGNVYDHIKKSFTLPEITKGDREIITEKLLKPRKFSKELDSGRRIEGHYKIMEVFNAYIYLQIPNGNCSEKNIRKYIINGDRTLPLYDIRSIGSYLDKLLSHEKINYLSRFYSKLLGIDQTEVVSILPKFMLMHARKKKEDRDWKLMMLPIVNKKALCNATKSGFDFIATKVEGDEEIGGRLCYEKLSCVFEGPKFSPKEKRKNFSMLRAGSDEFIYVQTVIRNCLFTSDNKYLSLTNFEKNPPEMTLKSSSGEEIQAIIDASTQIIRLIRPEEMGYREYCKLLQKKMEGALLKLLPGQKGDEENELAERVIQEREFFSFFIDSISEKKRIIPDKAFSFLINTWQVVTSGKSKNTLSNIYENLKKKIDHSDDPLLTLFFHKAFSLEEAYTILQLIAMLYHNSNDPETKAWRRCNGVQPILQVKWRSLFFNVDFPKEGTFVELTTNIFAFNKIDEALILSALSPTQKVTISNSKKREDAHNLSLEESISDLASLLSKKPDSIEKLTLSFYLFLLSDKNHKQIEAIIPRLLIGQYGKEEFSRILSHKIVQTYFMSVSTFSSISELKWTLIERNLRMKNKESMNQTVSIWRDFNPEEKKRRYETFLKELMSISPSHALVEIRQMFEDRIPRQEDIYISLLKISPESFFQEVLLLLYRFPLTREEKVILSLQCLSQKGVKGVTKGLRLEILQKNLALATSSDFSKKERINVVKSFLTFSEKNRPFCKKQSPEKTGESFQLLLKNYEEKEGVPLSDIVPLVLDLLGEKEYKIHPTVQDTFITLLSLLKTNGDGIDNLRNYLQDIFNQLFNFQESISDCYLTKLTEGYCWYCKKYRKRKKKGALLNEKNVESIIKREIEINEIACALKFWLTLPIQLQKNKSILTGIVPSLLKYLKQDSGDSHLTSRIVQSLSTHKKKLSEEKQVEYFQVLLIHYLKAKKTKKVKDLVKSASPAQLKIPGFYLCKSGQYTEALELLKNDCSNLLDVLRILQETNKFQDACELLLNNEDYFLTRRKVVSCLCHAALGSDKIHDPQLQRKLLQIASKFHVESEELGKILCREMVVVREPDEELKQLYLKWNKFVLTLLQSEESTIEDSLCKKLLLHNFSCLNFSYPEEAIKNLYHPLVKSLILLDGEFCKSVLFSTFKSFQKCPHEVSKFLEERSEYEKTSFWDFELELFFICLAMMREESENEALNQLNTFFSTRDEVTSRCTFTALDQLVQKINDKPEYLQSLIVLTKQLNCSMHLTFLDDFPFDKLIQVFVICLQQEKIMSSKLLGETILTLAHDLAVELEKKKYRPLIPELEISFFYTTTLTLNEVSYFQEFSTRLVKNEISAREEAIEIFLLTIKYVSERNFSLIAPLLMNLVQHNLPELATLLEEIEQEGKQYVLSKLLITLKEIFLSNGDKRLFISTLDEIYVALIKKNRDSSINGIYIQTLWDFYLRIYCDDPSREEKDILQSVVKNIYSTLFTVFENEKDSCRFERDIFYLYPLLSTLGYFLGAFRNNANHFPDGIDVIKLKNIVSKEWISLAKEVFANNKGKLNQYQKIGFILLFFELNDDAFISIFKEELTAYEKTFISDSNNIRLASDFRSFGTTIHHLFISYPDNPKKIGKSIDNIHAAYLKVYKQCIDVAAKNKPPINCELSSILETTEDQFDPDTYSSCDVLTILFIDLLSNLDPYFRKNPTKDAENKLCAIADLIKVGMNSLTDTVFVHDFLLRFIVNYQLYLPSKKVKKVFIDLAIQYFDRIQLIEKLLLVKGYKNDLFMGKIRQILSYDYMNYLYYYSDDPAEIASRINQLINHVRGLVNYFRTDGFPEYAELIEQEQKDLPTVYFIDK